MSVCQKLFLSTIANYLATVCSVVHQKKQLLCMLELDQPDTRSKMKTAKFWKTQWGYSCQDFALLHPIAGCEVPNESCTVPRIRFNNCQQDTPNPTSLPFKSPLLFFQNTDSFLLFSCQTRWSALCLTSDCHKCEKDMNRCIAAKTNKRCGELQR